MPLFFLGCTEILEELQGPPLPSGPSPVLTGYSEFQALTSRFRDLTPKVRPYIADIGARITRALPGRCAHLSQQIVILDARQPLALSFPHGAVVMSRGLITELGNEAEFIFVLGHELAHSCLDHFSRVAMGASRRDLEFEADSFGFEVMLRTNFSPADALQALARTHASRSSWRGVRGTYPSFQDRVANATEFLSLQSSLSPPTSRSFRRYQHILSGA